MTLENWQLITILSVNICVGLVVYFKEAINSIFLGEVQRRERRQERTREILIQLHDHQAEFFRALVRIAVNGFLMHQDPQRAKEYKSSQEEAAKLNYDGGSIAELPIEIRNRITPLANEVVEIHSRIITIVQSRNETGFLNRFREITDTQGRVLEALQEEIDAL